MSNEGFDSAKEGFDSAKKAAGENFDKAKEAASETFENVKESASETFEDAKEAATGAANDFKKEFDKFSGDKGNKRIIAGVMGIFFGWLGIHKFILGYTQEGIIQLVVGVLTCGTTGIIGIIEGIIYLTKSEEEFYQTYQVNKKPWF
ncbi:MAG: NINE protein [Nonlabens sp.]|uniref:NINE protein n=1 Tax=Nonlabens sp. TaxID=1888209 RepID=UPI003EFA76B4